MLSLSKLFSSNLSLQKVGSSSSKFSVPKRRCTTTNPPLKAQEEEEEEFEEDYDDDIEETKDQWAAVKTRMEELGLDPVHDDPASINDPLYLENWDYSAEQIAANLALEEETLPPKMYAFAAENMNYKIYVEIAKDRKRVNLPTLELQSRAGVFGESVKIATKLFEEAEKDNKTLDLCKEILALPHHTLQVQDFFAHTSNVNERYKMLESVFEEKPELSDLYKSALATVASEKNPRILTNVLHDVVKLYYASRGVIPAWFRWGSEPDDEVADTLVQNVANAYLRSNEVLVPSQEIQEELIGGFKLELPWGVMDHSWATVIEDRLQQVEAAAASEEEQ